ncbi:MAG: TIGR03960 family B12-binding radical SAM protein [Deltaproteobacteria bacterium]|nr:TIGR03960 family B12-binding radical SAM protein [Deltaproteobacteria bacterium]
MAWSLRRKYLDLLDREEGWVKKIWGDHMTICLAYPNHYRAGMSNLGFQTIYRIINNHPSFLCERVFLPDPEDEESFSSGSLPLFSLESQKPLREFDVVAFSIPFENDYPNILKMLDMAGIPLTAADRTDADPLIVGGGFSASLNPEPLADFFDLFLLGEGEDLAPEYLEAVKSARTGGLTKRETLYRIQRHVKGAYCPQYYKVEYTQDGLIESFKPLDPTFPEKIKRRKMTGIDHFTTDQCLTTPDTEFGGIFLTEVSRGCGRGCRFCAAGFVGRPPRFRHGEILASSIHRGLAAGQKIGLLGTAVSDMPDLPRVCRSIISQGGKFSIGSLRLDRINKETAALLGQAVAETVALAPEAGSQRLRDVIHKGITEEHIFTAADALLAQGITNIRLYFMVGLPSETAEDVEALIDLVQKIKGHAVKSPAGKRTFRLITVSVNQFIPKAATPFQWCPLEDVNAVRKKMRRIVSALRREKAVKVIHDIPKWNYIQALLSLGDRRVGKILLAAHRHGGNWSQAMKAADEDPDFYVYRRKDLSEILPWDFIDYGVTKSFLMKEYEKASQGAIT